MQEPRPAETAEPPTRSHPLQRATRLSIGRSGDGIVLGSPLVSRRHAELVREGEQHRIRDLGSTNGTLVNGRRIRERVLVSGDVIRIGAFRLVYDGTRLDVYDERGAVRITARGLWHSVIANRAPRALLHDLSFTVELREFVAIVGPSGAGKSTLLALLAGIYPPTQGDILLNGESLAADTTRFRPLIGYVPQDDALHGALSLGEGLAYAAALRLPDDTTPADAARRAAQVAAAVGLDDASSTPIGALSGGQRRRASIATELLRDPPLLFLDEPAAGLDPGRERQLMQTLRTIADSGRTVVLVTHATANISQCDLVAVLAAGQLIYYGPPAAISTYFGVATGDFAGLYTLIAASDPLALALRYRDSALYDEFVTARDQQRPAAPAARVIASERQSSAGRQFRILLRRGFQLMLHDPRTLAVLITQAPVLGLLIALVARRDAFVGANATLGEAQKTLFLPVIIAIWCGILVGTRTVAEWPILIRERLAGLRAAPYVLAAFAAPAALVALQALLLLAALALRLPLPAQGVLGAAPLEILITLVLTALAALAIGLAIAAAGRTAARASALLPPVLALQVLFGGVLFDLGDGGVARALSWLVPARPAADALAATLRIADLPLLPGGAPLALASADYAATPAVLLSRWAVLVLHTAVALGITTLLVRRGARG